MVGSSENIPAGLGNGFIVHENLKERWEFIRGDSHQEIPKIEKMIDLFIHDSDHAFDFLTKEINLVWDKLKSDSLILADDLDWSNGFYSICAQRKLYPLIITDNGKSGLRARTGIVRMDHPFRQEKDIVG